MSVGNRALFVLLGVLSAVTVGCGGGGSAPNPVRTATPSPVATATQTQAATPTPTPTATATTSPAPTATPSAGTPTPSPTPMPTGAPNPVASRPLTSGDTFTYAGNSLETFLYRGAAPNPSGTVAYAVTQQVTDDGPQAFNGANPYDLHTVETDRGSNQTLAVTPDAYYATGAYSGTQTGFYSYGYSSSDTNGQHITEKITDVSPSNGLVDILPETQAQAWTNNGAQTLAESESDGFSADRTTAANGTYSETDLYPQGSQFTPSPSPLPATLSDNTDGSGSYSFPLFGSTPNAALTFSAPSGGEITIVVDAFGQTPSYTVATWYSLPLYVETDSQLGALPIPGACNVPSQFGTTANGVQQQYVKTDTVLGTTEDYSETTYIVGGYAVCVALNDVTDVYYDYSGQGNGTFGVAFSGGQSPLEVITLASTVGLTATSVSGADRGRDSLQAGAQRVAFARTNFESMLERGRLERRRLAYQRLRAGFFERSHR
jgi:hypothetical protein